MEIAMLKIVLLDLLLLLSWQGISLAEAIEMGGLQGAVRDENGKPLTGAAVKVRNLERGVTVTVFSREGNYGAPELFPGKSEVSVGPGGHAEGAKAEIEIAPGRKTLLNFALKRSAPILTRADWIPQLPDDGDGVKQLVINRCVNCHGAVNLVSGRFDRLGWKKIVIDMGRIEETGPPNYRSISDEEAMASKSEEAERIAAYLARHFGPDRAPGLNVPKAVAYRNTVGEPDVVITQFDIPTRTAIPHNLTVDPRGHVWFVERYGENIGRLDPATAAIREYAPPTRYSGPRRLALDRNGNVWFTEYNTNKIALLDQESGAIREWEIPTPDSGPYDIVVDHSGKIWFDEFTANKIVRFDPATAKFSEFPLPGLDSQVRKIALDQSGAVWLSEYKNSRMVRVVERR